LSISCASQLEVPVVKGESALSDSSWYTKNKTKGNSTEIRSSNFF
jgi:hypothetical protein